MARTLVLYYSTYGHVEAMANEIAAGVRSVDGGDATIRRVAELMPKEALESSGAKVDQDAPVISGPDELLDYDAIVFGTPTRFGNMCSQMRNFLDQTGGLWAKGALIGKVGSVFTSTGTGGGQETTITSFHSTLLHHGFVILGLPYSSAELTDISEVRGGSPYGAATIAGPEGKRMPSDAERKLARDQGARVAEVAKKLHG